MKMISKNHISVILCSLLLSILHVQQCLSQQSIKLTDVANFELTMREGGMGNAYRILKVTPSGNGWKCYQTGYNGFGSQLNDTIKTFIKKVPSKVLEKLLAIIAKRDTEINTDYFNISNAKLKAYIDTVSPNLNPQQTVEFINATRSKSIVKDALKEALHPMLMDDKTYYGIIITTKLGVKDTIAAYSFGYLYDLPWYINHTTCYDPNISLIYAFISDDNRYPIQEKQWLYRDLVKNIYWKYFETRFNWDNFKSDQPASYAILKGTLTPVHFIANNIGSRVYFQSSLLPSYVRLETGFKRNDTAEIQHVKRYEDTLERVFKKDNFLFRYIKTRSDVIISLDATEMEEYGKWAFREIKKYYAGIDSFDYKQSLLLRVYGSDDLRSTWILLPNNTLILLKFPEVSIQKNSILLKFMNLNRDVIGKKDLAGEKHVCIIFDANGNVIHNYGKAYISFGRVF